jgi:hypothetical protein
MISEVFDEPIAFFIIRHLFRGFVLGHVERCLGSTKCHQRLITEGCKCRKHLISGRQSHDKRVRFSSVTLSSLVESGVLRNDPLDWCESISAIEFWVGVLFEAKDDDGGGFLELCHGFFNVLVILFDLWQLLQYIFVLVEQVGQVYLCLCGFKKDLICLHLLICPLIFHVGYLLFESEDMALEVLRIGHSSIQYRYQSLFQISS